MTTEVMLYCLGCGGAVAPFVEGQTLAISCGCGAMAPILVSTNPASGDLMYLGPPVSLVRVLSSEGPPDKPHLEYWLGYSDHESPMKNNFTDALRKAGCISRAECGEQECRLAYVRGKSEWAELSRRLGDAFRTSDG